MRTQHPTIRGISIALTPERRLGAPRRMGFKIILDEKPLGRVMRANWQQAIILEDEVSLDAPLAYEPVRFIINQIKAALLSKADLSPDVGTSVELSDAPYLGRHRSQWFRQAVADDLGKMLDRTIPLHPSS